MKNTYRFMLAAVVIGGLVGCGGNGKNPSGIAGNVVPLSGGVSTVVRTDTPSLPATPAGTAGTPTSYTTTVNGQSRTVLVAAASTSAPAGTPIAVIPDNIPIIQGSFTRAPGDLVITYAPANGSSTTVTTRYTSIVSSVNGALVLLQPVGLRPGFYSGTVEGPIYIVSGTKTLTVGTLDFAFEVTPTGVCTAPKTISGTLPMNGGSTNDPNVAATVKVANTLVGGPTSLAITLTSQTSVSQTGFFSLVGTDGQFTFRSLNGGFTVPSTGVQSVSFSSYAPVP